MGSARRAVRSARPKLVPGDIIHSPFPDERGWVCPTHDGPFYQPTVLADVTPAMKVYDEETFAPVTSILRVKDADHALQVANDTSYGLSSSVMTRDIDTALKFAEQLEAGMVHINDCTLHDEPTAPFGGVKNSGFGRENGRCGIEEMTELKWITIQSGRRAFPF